MRFDIFMGRNYFPAMRSLWTWQNQSRGLWSGASFSATRALVIANVVCFVLQLLLEQMVPGFVDRWLALSRGGLASGFVWQLVTYMFLHGSLLHIVANMLVIYFAGRQVEQILGMRAFLALYFAGGLAGGVAQVIASDGGIVGASAAGFATLLAFTTILPEMEITLLLFFVIPVRMRAKYLAYGAIGISLLFTILPSGDGIGHAAHLAGCLTGYLFARRLGFGRPLRPERMLAERRAREQRKGDLSPEEFISEEIDPILEKISRHGMHSLTRQERRTLDRGRERIEQRTRSRESGVLR